MTFAKWIAIAIGFGCLHSIANPDCDTESAYPFILISDVGLIMWSYAAGLSRYKG